MSLHFLTSDDDLAMIGAKELDLISEVFSSFLPDKTYEVELVLLDASEMKKLNMTSRSLDTPTDVLSFPTFESMRQIEEHPIQEHILLGSIAICPEKAEEYGETLPQLTHHGLLHLLGYDHETDIQSWKIQESIALQALAKINLIIPGIPL